MDQLEQVEWFTTVGQHVDGPFVLVKSWDAAVARCGLPEWEDLLLEASNRYTELVARKAPGRFQKWNDITDEVKAITVPLVQKKIAGVVQKNRLPKVFENIVQWDILAVCMEAEYADVQPPGFFASQAYWYVNGHFPCGWDGPFPEGMLVLY